MKYIIIFSFLFSSLFANTKLIDLYRTSGIQAVESYINKQLTHYEYWQNYLSLVDTQYGYYESIQNILKCDKNMENIEVYKYQNGKTKKIFNSKVLLGEVQGDKKSEGDLKTPLGVYEFSQLKTSLDPFYGPLALVTNYPNNFDQLQGKTGSGIWIHGVPYKGERKPFTKGCIALENDQVKTLNQSIKYDNSVLIIDNKNLTSSKEELANILSQIFSWKDAWQSGDLDSYLSFYGDNFKKSNGMDFSQFIKYKTRIFAKDEKKSIVYKDLNVIPYPNSLNKKIYAVKYFQEYSAPSFQSKDKKELYIELIDNKIKILFES